MFQGGFLCFISYDYLHCCLLDFNWRRSLFSFAGSPVFEEVLDAVSEEPEGQDDEKDQEAK